MTARAMPYTHTLGGHGLTARRGRPPRGPAGDSRPAGGRVARQIGLDLLPWQQQVVNAALEQSRGRPAYRDVYVSVPRQSGKSTLALARILWQMTEFPGSHAHVRRAEPGCGPAEDAGPRGGRGWPSSPLAGDLTLFRGFGNESITHANGSVLRPAVGGRVAPGTENHDLVSWMSLGHVD